MTKRESGFGVTGPYSSEMSSGSWNSEMKVSILGEIPLKEMKSVSYC